MRRLNRVINEVDAETMSSSDSNEESASEEEIIQDDQEEVQRRNAQFLRESEATFDGEENMENFISETITPKTSKKSDSRHNKKRGRESSSESDRESVKRKKADDEEYIAGN